MRIGGKIVFRHSPDLTATWSQSTSIGESVPGSSSYVILPLKPGKYLARAYDSSKIPSVLAAEVTTDQATALEYANVDTLTEHPAFSGAKVNCLVSGSNLILDGEGLLDDIPDFDDVPDLDSLGNIAATGTYSFSGGFDFTTKRHVRLTSHVRATIFNVYDLFDGRTSAIDDWDDFDGEATDEADAQVWVRTTDDDPSGSPTWKAWQRCDSLEVHCRAVEADLRLFSYDGTFNIQIHELELIADEVA